MKFSFRQWNAIANALEEKARSVKADYEWHARYAEEHDRELDDEAKALKDSYEELLGIVKVINDATI